MYASVKLGMEFDFKDHVLRIETNEWASRTIPLKGFSVVIESG